MKEIYKVDILAHLLYVRFEKKFFKKNYMTTYEFNLIEDGLNEKIKNTRISAKREIYRAFLIDAFICALKTACIMLTCVIIFLILSEFAKADSTTDQSYRLQQQLNAQQEQFYQQEMIDAQRQQNFLLQQQIQNQQRYQNQQNTRGIDPWIIMQGNQPYIPLR